MRSLRPWRRWTARSNRWRANKLRKARAIAGRPSHQLAKVFRENTEIGSSRSLEKSQVLLTQSWPVGYSLSVSVGGFTRGLGLSHAAGLTESCCGDWFDECSSIIGPGSASAVSPTAQYLSERADHEDCYGSASDGTAQPGDSAGTVSIDESRERVV